MGGVAKFLPGAAVEAIIGGSFYADTGMAPGLLPSWEGLLVLLRYAVLFAAAGRLTTRRRDSPNRFP
ncbi:hypothetical protein [Georgenia sp. AZ-5]|uniref:hypothetical protein n=1 Tax=Georgenia sp. AZ-5 TaxID=3367526 RepID=UPI003754D52F